MSKVITSRDHLSCCLHARSILSVIASFLPAQQGLEQVQPWIHVVGRDEIEHLVRLGSSHVQQSHERTVEHRLHESRVTYDVLWLDRLVAVHVDVAPALQSDCCSWPRES